ncbi:MAG: sialidase family protein [Bacteroidota bacterium]
MTARSILVLPLALTLAACGTSDASPPTAGGEADTVVADASLTLTGDVSVTPSVAALPDGRALVVAVTGDPAEVRLWRVGADGQAGEAVIVSPPGERAPSPSSDVQVVSVGERVHVLWRNRIEIPGRAWPGADLWLATSDDGGQTFGAPVAVNDDQGGRPTEHAFQSLAAGPDGALHAVWIDFRRQDAARTAPAQAHAAHGHTPIRLVHDTEAALPGAEIRAAVSRDGGRSFGPSVVLDTTACECCPTAVAVAPDGAVVAAWRSIFPGSERDIATARSTDGGQTFTERARVHRDAWAIEGCPHNGPSLAVEDGRTTVTWFTGAEERMGRYAASASGDGAFEAPVSLGGPQSSHAALAPGPEGTWAVWEAAGDSARVALAPLDNAAAPMDLGAGRLPALYVSGDRWAAAWVDGDALRFRSGSTTGPSDAP